MIALGLMDSYSEETDKLRMNRSPDLTAPQYEEPRAAASPICHFLLIFCATVSFFLYFSAVPQVKWEQKMILHEIINTYGKY